MSSPLTARRASRVGCRLRSSVGRKNSTDKTTAASPLTGWNPVCLSRSAAVNPIEVSNHLMRMSMTLPARVAPDYHSGADTQLPIDCPPAPDAAGMLRSALAADVSPKAYRLYALMVLTGLGADRWLTGEQIADRAAMTPHQCRALVAELTRARLVVRTKVVVTRDGVASARYRYSLAGVTA